MEFGHWAALLCEQYAAQQLPIPSDEMNWQDWGASLLAIDLFVNQGIPSPYAYDDWQEWASAVLNVMNGGA